MPSAIEALIELREWLNEEYQRTDIDLSESALNGEGDAVIRSYHAQLRTLSATQGKIDYMIAQISTGQSDNYRNITPDAKTWSRKAPTEPGWYWFVSIGAPLNMIPIEAVLHPTMNWLEIKCPANVRPNSGRWMPISLPAKPAF